MQSFEEILGEVSADSFLEESWGQQPRLIEGPRDKFTHLFEWQRLNEVLEADFLRTPRLRLVANGKRLEASRYMRQINDAESIDALGLTNCLSEGAALIIDEVDKLFPAVRVTAVGIEDFFAAGCSINLYCGWKASKGFDVHWDVHDVIVLQVQGDKAWQVWSPTRLHPLKGDKAPEPNEEPYWQGTLRQGQVLYVPRGWWHRAEALDQTSVHLTAGVRPATGSDFVKAMRVGITEHESMRATLAPANSKQHAAVLATVADHVDPSALERFLHNDAAAVWTRADFNLPEAASLPPVDITGETTLKLAWTRGLVFDPQPDGSTRLTTVGLSAQCSTELVPYLKRLQGTSTTTLDAVRDGLEDRALRRELTVLISTLVMKGALYAE